MLINELRGEEYTIVIKSIKKITLITVPFLKRIKSNDTYKIKIYLTYFYQTHNLVCNEFIINIETYIIRK